MSQDSPAEARPDRAALGFEEACRANLQLFSQSSYDQRIEWLASMLELWTCVKGQARSHGEPGTPSRPV